MAEYRMLAAVIVAILVYVAALYLPQPAGYTIAPIAAAVIAALAGTPRRAAAAGLLAGGGGYLLALASTGGVEALKMIVGIGSPLALLIVASYHTLAPAGLAYVLEPLLRRAASRSPQTVP